MCKSLFTSSNLGHFFLPNTYKIMKDKIKHNWVNILFWTTFALSFWIIFALGLNILPLINCSFNESFILNINSVLLNLSYSYIAGCIFYFLSVVLPRYKEQKQINPAIKIKIKNIERYVFDILIEFARETNYSINISDIDSCSKALNSKRWTDNVPYLKKLYNINEDYLWLINNKRIAISNEINEIIIGYKSYLTSEQLVTLEKIRNAEIFRFVTFWMNIENKNLDDPGGMAYATKIFCDLLILINNLSNSLSEPSKGE